MATIKILDDVSVELITAQAGPGSGIAKYFKGDTAALIAAKQLADALPAPVATLTAAPLGFGLKLTQGGAFGTSGAEWRLQANAKVSVDATQSGDVIPGDAVFANSLKVPLGHTYVGTAFTPSLAAEISSTLGDLKFGFNAGALVEFRAGRFFPSSATSPKLADALKELLVSSVVPGDIQDLKQMNVGDVTSVSGAGQFKFSGKFNAAQALNPLATPTLGLEAIGAVTLQPSAGIEVAASVGVRGAYQIRVHKTAQDTVRLGLYKMAGTQFGFDVTASAGLEVSLGKKKLTEKLLSFLGGTPVDAVNLVDAGLSDAQIETLKKAVEASLSRSLEISLAGSFAAKSEETAVFEYEFDLAAIDAAGSDALHRALDADFSPLTSLASTALPAGIRLLVSAAHSVREKSFTWRVNLLGIVNVLSVSRLVKDGKAVFDAQTGELVITDTATATKLQVATNALEAKPERLRKLLMQAAILTAAYRASGAGRELTFAGSVSYFDRKANASAQNISDYLDNLVALGLTDVAGKQDFLNRFVAGRASLLAEAQFHSASVEAMFLKDGAPYKQQHYDEIGRNCLAALIQPSDPDSFRRRPLTDSNLWKQMTDEGPFRFAFILPQELRKEPKLSMIINDYIVIRWWSRAMAVAAERVGEMRQFLTNNTHLSAEALKNNKQFQKLRRELHDKLGDVVKRTTPDFVDAWGAIAMYKAALEHGEVRGILLTDGPVFAESRSMRQIAAG